MAKLYFLLAVFLLAGVGIHAWYVEHLHQQREIANEINRSVAKFQYLTKEYARIAAEFGETTDEYQQLTREYGTIADRISKSPAPIFITVPQHQGETYGYRRVQR
jgi:hypothetical protein